jgi:tripartite-type tricarboxylate transporter receptor subunit TctC
MDRSRRRTMQALAVSLVPSALVSPAARAQAPAFPSKPLVIVVPATPGGILDLSSRLIAGELSKRIGQPVTVDNKAGGGQVIGMQAMLRAEPDGHTLVMGSIGPNAANYSIFQKLPYAPADFAPVAHVVSMPNVLLVHPSVPATSVAELVALAKARPGALSIASSGTATSSHLAGEMLKMRAGIDLVHVPYKGAAAAVNDLVGGQVQVSVQSLPSSIAFIKSGRIKVLGVVNEKRLAALPDAAPINETVKGLAVTPWYGVFAPAGTPAPVVTQLQALVARALEAPDVREKLANVGAEPYRLSAEQFSALIRSELPRWAKAVKDSGATID